VHLHEIRSGCDLDRDMAGDQIGKAGRRAAIGTARRSMPAVRANMTPRKCGSAPAPGMAKLASDGLAFAQATKSRGVLASTCGPMAMPKSNPPTWEIGASSAIGS
jgi:hypothetical protein